VISHKTQFLNRIKSLPKFGDGICLDRVDYAILQLGLKNYLADTDKVVITGTNGKGSVAKLVNEILCVSGLNCGLFTSPHFIEFNERFEVSRNPVAYNLLEQICARIMPQLDKIEQEFTEKFGVFEVLFLLSLKVFQALNVNFLIIEAGIGGRYDPVRVLRSKLTALTSIDLEHCNLLGDTKELIAFDKIDACASGGEVVIGKLEASLKRKIGSYCAIRNIEVTDSQDIAINKQSDSAKNGHEIALDLDKSFCCYPNSFDLCALENLKTVLCLSEKILKNTIQNTDIDIRVEHYIKAIEQFENPGRFSVIKTQPKVIVDSAHTQASFSLLFDTLRSEYHASELIFLVGISQGRDPHHLIDGITAMAAHCIVSKASFKGAEPESIYTQLNSKGVPCTLEIQLTSAIEMALKKAKKSGAIIIVCGGLFFAGEVTSLINNKTDHDIFLY
jgi:dihydrofolate synthase/folylpolyglutamate synthase